MLLDEGDGVAHFLGGVLLHVVLAVAQRGGELEHGDAVLELEALGDDAVAEERAVAGGVALHCAGAEHGGVVVDGDAYLGLRHRAHVARKAELLRLLCQFEEINIAQSVAVGDGANDLPMLNLAGLGIAFHAKPKVKATARQSISTIGLDGILYFLGLKDSRIEQ